MKEVQPTVWYITLSAETSAAAAPIGQTALHFTFNMNEVFPEPHWSTRFYYGRK